MGIGERSSKAEWLSANLELYRTLFSAREQITSALELVLMERIKKFIPFLISASWECRDKASFELDIYDEVIEITLPLRMSEQAYAKIVEVSWDLARRFGIHLFPAEDQIPQHVEDNYERPCLMSSDQFVALLDWTGQYIDLSGEHSGRLWFGSP